jgi:hypothetical protein
MGPKIAVLSPGWISAQAWVTGRGSEAGGLRSGEHATAQGGGEGPAEAVFVAVPRKLGEANVHSGK